MCTLLEISRHSPHHFLLSVPILLPSFMLPASSMKPTVFVTPFPGYIVLLMLGFLEIRKWEHNNNVKYYHIKMVLQV